MNDELIKRLNRINWDFGTKKNVADDENIYPFNNRRFHSYPATYIPELPFSLIEILSNVNDVVLDPFGGIGTTFVQALIQKRVPISIDNNSMASHITEDFYYLFDPEAQLIQSAETLATICKEYKKEKNYFDTLVGERKELSEWYEHDTLNELSFLISEYDKLSMRSAESGTIRLFHLILSNLLTTVSSQNGGWAYIADNVKPKSDMYVYKHPCERFEQSVLQCAKYIESYKERIGRSGIPAYVMRSFDKVVCADFATYDVTQLTGLVDLVVTSPPYPKMIDYVKSQRLSYYLEMQSFQAELKTEIGARARRNRPDSVENYIEDMKKCNRKIYECLRKNGILCYILPRFSEEKDLERKLAIDSIIEDCVSIGFHKCREIERCIPGTQRSNNIKWASLKKEVIIIMEKDA